MNSASLIQQAAHHLNQSRFPVVLTGAGISAESGIPTFRDALTGLWENYQPEKLATAEAFQKTPELVHAFYEYRRNLIRRCAPNPAHHALARLSGIKPALRLITQNVDNFHQLAGSPGVIALHGNIFESRCSRGCSGMVDLRSPQPAPLNALECPVCSSPSMRPNVVWFGECLDEAILNEANEAVDQCDLLFIIGTSGLVYPAAALPRSAMKRKIPVIEINPRKTDYSHRAILYIPQPAGEALPAIVEALLSISPE